MPSSFKFWIMHFTTFCLCLYPESDCPVEDFLVRKHCGTKFWESLSLFTRRNLVVILEALKVEKSWEYCFDGEFYLRSSFSHLFEQRGFPCGSDGKESASNARDLSSIPGSGRSPGVQNGYQIQYSCLENSMDRGAWWATVHGFT